MRSRGDRRSPWTPSRRSPGPIARAVRYKGAEALEVVSRYRGVCNRTRVPLSIGIERRCEMLCRIEGWFGNPLSTCVAWIRFLFVITCLPANTSAQYNLFGWKLRRSGSGMWGRTIDSLQCPSNMDPGFQSLIWTDSLVQLVFNWFRFCNYSHWCCRSIQKWTSQGVLWVIGWL